MNYIEIIADYLFNKYSEAYDPIPDNFDFINNDYAIEFKMAENVTDIHYANNIYLQVRVVGVVDKKYKIINKALTLLEELDGDRIPNLDYRIIKENVPYTSYLDEDKFNVVLMLNIRKYNY